MGPTQATVSPILDRFLAELARQSGSGDWRAQMVEGMTEEKVAEVLKGTEAALLCALDTVAADNLVLRSHLREMVTLHTWEAEAKSHGHPVPPECERLPALWDKATDLVTQGG